MQLIKILANTGAGPGFYSNFVPVPFIGRAGAAAVGLFSLLVLVLVPVQCLKQSADYEVARVGCW